MKKIITELELTNIGPHSHLKCEFREGINTLSGPSGIGKSFIIHAMQSVYFNRPSINDLRKYDTKKSVIRLTYSDNTVIERIISTSVNRYTLQLGEELKTFDSVGRDVPEEIQQHTSAYPVSVDGTTFYLPLQEQLRNSLFLFDENIKPATKYKFFNLLTGNDVLDKLFKEFNSDLLKAKKDIKYYSEDHESDSKKLKKINQELEYNQRILDNIDLESVQKLDKELKEIEQKRDKLLELDVSINKLQSELKTLKAIKPEGLDKLLTRIELLEQLELKKRRLSDLDKKIAYDTNKLKTLKFDPLLCELGDAVDRYDQLVEGKTKLDKLDNNILVVNKKIKKLESIIKDGEREFQALMEESGTCPLCGK